MKNFTVTKTSKESIINIFDLIYQINSTNNWCAPSYKKANQEDQISQNQFRSFHIKPIGNDLSYTTLPLITCTCVIVANKHQGLILHAGSGSIGTDFIEAISSLGNPKKLVAIYATPKSRDPDYEKDANKLVTAGIPTDNIAFIENVGTAFSINERGEISCTRY